LASGRCWWVGSGWGVLCEKKLVIGGHVRRLLPMESIRHKWWRRGTAPKECIKFEGAILHSKCATVGSNDVGERAVTTTFAPHSRKHTTRSRYYRRGASPFASAIDPCASDHPQIRIAGPRRLSRGRGRKLKTETCDNTRRAEKFSERFKTSDVSFGTNNKTSNKY
jgi:hypothetical protein